MLLTGKLLIWEKGYYEKYKKEYNVTNDDFFNGVLLKLIPLLENTLKTRINVYEIHSLEYNKSQQKVDQNGKITITKCTPILNLLHSCDRSIDVYKPQCKTLHLLLYKDHYYTIRDMSRLMVSNYICYGCGKKFVKTRTTNLYRHIRNHCDKLNRRYKEGMVEGHKNMFEEAKHLFSIGDDLLPRLDKEKFYTKEYMTYDFEAMINKIPVQQLSSDNFSNIIDENCNKEQKEEEEEEEARKYVPDQDRNVIFEQLQEKLTTDSSNFVSVNRPLSFGIGCNFPVENKKDNNEERENEEEIKQVIENANVKVYEYDNENDDDDDDDDDDDSWSVIYGVDKCPRNLTLKFLNSLRLLSNLRRKRVLDRYEEIIYHIELWFQEKGLEVSLRTTEGMCNFNDLASVMTDREEKNSVNDDDDGEGDELSEKEQSTCLKSRDYALKMYNKELALARRIKIFFNILPVWGFNSSSYDLPLIKSYMYDVLINDFKIETSDVQFIKKQSRYVSVSITSLAGVEITLNPSKYGGLQFLDIMQYLAPGFSLDDFIRSFGNGKETEQKSYFPYEFMDSFEKLNDVTSLPPYKSFHTRLRNVKCAEFRILLVFFKK